MTVSTTRQPFKSRRFFLTLSGVLIVAFAIFNYVSSKAAIRETFSSHFENPISDV